jgi:hypothetical protein
MVSDYSYCLVDVLPLSFCSQLLLSRPLFWHTAFESLGSNVENGYNVIHVYMHIRHTLFPSPLVDK